MYHSRTVLSVGGSVWYMVRNLRCTVTIDSVLVDSKTQNAFLFPVYAMFRHDCPLAVKYANTPRCLVHKNVLGDILYLLTCFLLLCLYWLLRSRFRKFRRELLITLCTICLTNARTYIRVYTIILYYLLLLLFLLYVRRVITVYVISI
jgi:hypothetical protein